MKYRLLLMLAAFIWGTAFVAQRVSTETMGPFSFNGIRFALGAVSIVLFMLLKNKPRYKKAKKTPSRMLLFSVCCTLGFILFAGAGLQQIGMIYTTAGKAGFITALYIVAVPVFGLFLKNPMRLSHIGGCCIAIVGLYFLTFHNEGGQAFNIGDLLELFGVIFWTLHILCIARFAQYCPALQLAAGQFAACSIFNFLAVIVTGENLTWTNVIQTAIPLIYGGLFSGGIAFTLQIIGQAHVPPTEASLLLSFEMIFSALSGYVLLGEAMTVREIVGCLLMGCGVFAAQIPSRIIWRRV